MKISIDENCLGCGLCAGQVQDVFSIGDDGYAKVKVEKVPEEKVEIVKQVMEGCPAGAIKEVKKEDK